MKVLLLQPPSIKRLLWENVQHSNFNGQLSKGASMTDVPVTYIFFYKIKILPFISFYAQSSPFCFPTVLLLHSFCIFERVFCCVCLHFHTLPFFVCFLFFSILKLCSLKAPRKAVLFHEYQASTGRFNKFVSLLAATLSFFYINTLSPYVFNYRPAILKKKIK